MEKEKKNLKQWLSFPGACIEKIENLEGSWFYFYVFFLFIIFLRCLIEEFSANTGISLTMHLHFVLYYHSVFLGILCVLKIFTRENIEKIFKVSSLAFNLIIAGPVIDICLSGTRATRILYYFEISFEEMIRRYLSFFGAYNGYGATPGIRFHLFLIISLIGVYVFLKTRKETVKALAAMFISYNILFLSAIFPLLFNRLTGLVYSDYLMSIVFFQGSLFFGTALFFVSNKPLAKSILKDARYLRVFYYLFLFALGLAIGYRHNQNAVFEYFVPVVLQIILSFMFAIFFTIITNNKADYNIDKVCNKDRPLISEKIDPEEYQKFGKASLVLSLTGAALINYRAFFFIFLFIATYYFDSMPPLRLKRVTFFSKLAISLNSLYMVLLGYSLYLEPNIKGYYFFKSFPLEYIWFFLIFTFAANFIDIKDYEGDKNENIKTLPVILGLERAKKLIGIFFAFPFLFIALHEPDYILYCILFSLINFRLINARQYNEKRIFYSFLTGITLLIYSIMTSEPGSGFLFI
jgi:4-hydroxybenzoate polyprenyltransferase